jgi:predicted alpha/beta-hydrolase family hydrolase
MSAPTLTPFSNDDAEPPVHGFLHTPANPNGEALLLTHGAGANCQSKLLIAVADAFAAEGLSVLRFDLPFRIDRRFGPPRGSGERDRDGLRRAVTLIRQKVPGRVFLAGHSYGGRQATMLLSEDPQLVDGLLLFSYPLHRPDKPAQLRTSHFPQLRTPCLFIHGMRDPFGSLDEMNAALPLIPAPHQLLPIDGAAHDLLLKKAPGDLPMRVLREFQAFFRR